VVVLSSSRQVTGQKLTSTTTAFFHSISSALFAWIY